MHVTTSVSVSAAGSRLRAPAAYLSWQRFRHHRLGMVSLGVLLALIGYVCLGALIVSEADANRPDASQRLQAPSAAHLFGTDVVGRDILARTVYGGQISLLIGGTAVGLSLLIGIPVGTLAAYYGGVLDSGLMRVTEAVLTIPPLFLLIVAAKFLAAQASPLPIGGRLLNGNVVVIVLLIGLTSWPALARLLRAHMLVLKEQEFVLAARSLGATDTAIMIAHLLPNALAPIVVNATLGMANAIVSEAYISFLGLGVRQPTATWGNMLEDAPRYLSQAPWLWIFPGGLMVLTVLAINGIGDGLREALHG